MGYTGAEFVEWGEVDSTGRGAVVFACDNHAVAPCKRALRMPYAQSHKVPHHRAGHCILSGDHWVFSEARSSPFSFTEYVMVEGDRRSSLGGADVTLSTVIAAIWDTGHDSMDWTAAVLVGG